MALLAGAAVGATVGGITGALIGMGIPEIEAKRYEGKIKEGNILLSVHADNATEVETAKRVFREANAQDISSTGEASVTGKTEATSKGRESAKHGSTTVIGARTTDADETNREGASLKD